MVVIEEVRAYGPVRPDAPTAEEGGVSRQSSPYPDLPRRDLFALYQGWLDRVMALEAAQITGEFASPEFRGAQSMRARRRSGHLRPAPTRSRPPCAPRRAKEKQLNRRVELNLEIKRLEAELVEVACTNYRRPAKHMNTAPTQDYLNGLVDELRKLPEETGWVEFKENNTNPEEIGEYLSALSNTAALLGKANGYLVWGVQDKTHAVVGTSFKPAQTKKGNEVLENWLVRLLNPRLHFRFYELMHEGKPVVVLEIPRASGRPVQFQGVEFIRIGSYRQKLKDNPQIEKELWRIFDTTPFEELIAMPARAYGHGVVVARLSQLLRVVGPVPAIRPGQDSCPADRTIG